MLNNLMAIFLSFSMVHNSAHATPHHAPKVAQAVHKAKASLYRLYEAGIASWYGIGDGFQGLLTASGVRFDTNANMCAHRFLPLGTVIVIENTVNHVRVSCKILDRGPYADNRVLDMSHAVKVALGAGDLTQVKLWVKRSEQYH